MAEVLHRSTVGQPSAQVDSKERLGCSLDHLLKRYLQLLDQYQTLQQELTQHLSRGYLQLALANFSTPNRVRYGQEHYDDRMQATSRVSISKLPPYFSTTKPRAEEIVWASNGVDDNDDSDRVSFPSKGSQSRSNMTHNPLNWFGILVPPALRTSQTSFKDAVTDLIPALASISEEMREVEIMVRRSRTISKKAV